MTGLATGLIIAGAASEAVGILLVAFDVWEAGRQRRELSRGAQLVQVGVAEAEAGANAPTIATIGGAAIPEPPLDERLSKLERDVEKIQELIKMHRERERRAHGEMLDRVAEWVGEARREVFELRQEIRPLIGQAVAGRLWLRATGVLAFLVGLGLQTAGNLL